MPDQSKSLSVVDRFQSEVAAIREGPLPKSAQFTVHLLAGMCVVAAALLWLAKVDRVIASDSGKIIGISRQTVFQALEPSIIKSIDVKEGERVSKGQVVATLDATFTGADVTQSTQQLASLDAQVARTEAELAGTLPQFADSPDATRRHYADLQNALFNQRQAQYAAQIKSYDQKINQTLATLEKFSNDESRLKEREQIAKQIEDMRSQLVKSGAGTLLNLLGSTDQRLELLRSLENGHNSYIEAQHQLSSLRADKEAFTQQWRGDVSKELVGARNARDTAVAQLDKARKRSDLVRLVAPEDEIILTIAKLSVGSILKEGDSLITAVPLGSGVQAQARIASRDVGFVKVGDKATMMVDAFNHVEHGTASGTVQWISEGSFQTDEETGQPRDPYYRVGISIDEMHFVGVPSNFRLVPGMTMTADINVGRRSLGAYLLDSLIKGAGQAMREP